MKLTILFCKTERMNVEITFSIIPKRRVEEILIEIFKLCLRFVMKTKKIYEFLNRRIFSASELCLDSSKSEIRIASRQICDRNFRTWRRIGVFTGKFWIRIHSGAVHKWRYAIFETPYTIITLFWTVIKKSRLFPFKATTSFMDDPIVLTLSKECISHFLPIK